MSEVAKATLFIPFKESIASYTLPKHFTFPFYYTPDPLCRLAAKELQQHLLTQTDWEHNFGIVPNKKGAIIGKMFGVLVVQNQQQEIGYLAAFSGKLANKNHHPNFVPPVFDILTEDGFFNKGSVRLNEINREVEKLEQIPEFLLFQQVLKEEEALASSKIDAEKQKISAAKKARRVRKKATAATGNIAAIEALQIELAKESLVGRRYFQQVQRYWEQRVASCQEKVDQYLIPLNQLKEERKTKSAALQKRLFQAYSFLNQNGERKSLLDIFEHTTLKKPPAGAGECAAPKLLHYAFQQQLKPIAMAEFWWGESFSEIRRHQNFYPACRGKCEPILAHMLQGMEIEKNPMLTNPAEGKILTTVYEDEAVIIINKPPEFLSVPGKNIEDSVWLRMKQKFPAATGPLIVHRLDMSTSGLLIIAKTKEAHKFIQQQFIKRTIKKRYVALLEGVIEKDEGYVNLPLRVDLDDRPRQMVCYEHGRAAQTRWQVLERREAHTKIHFFPFTGRTHQLRVHAAHPQGLNRPIVGDDLYGVKGERLHLHAEWIEFLHPITRERMGFTVAPEF